MEMNYKLGKLPARPGAVKFSLDRYMALSALPTAPAVFGPAGDLAWGVLGNDQYGDCVWAGAAHEHMLWNASVGRKIAFNTAAVLSDYSAATGFNPNDPNSDQGTDMEEAAKYRRKIGIVDGNGARHQLGAYVAIPGVSTKGNNTPTLLTTLINAAYSFEAVGIGIEFPASAMDQFDAGQPWDVVSGSAIEGGHYVPVVGRRANGNILVVTWGKIQEVTPAFLLKYVDEAIAYLSTEALSEGGTTREGFNIDALNADLASLGGTPVPTPSPSPVPTPTPTPSPTPVGVPPFPLAEVQPWLDARCFTLKGKAAQKAIKEWLTAGGR